ncbi:hypothetical protein F2Y18_04785 [Bacillus cereus]|nr:hypothetical protein F2Y18_04785 [Bacillus cereus]
MIKFLFSLVHPLATSVSSYRTYILNKRLFNHFSLVTKPGNTLHDKGVQIKGNNYFGRNSESIP